MFCPQCGAREQQPKQFCRACGTDLRLVRSTLEKPEEAALSIDAARHEIGRAFALKIKEIQSAHDLKKVAEDVLPEIEKFLESPAEKRLRRLRTGVITAAIGLGAMLVGPLLSELLHERDLRLLGAMGIIPFLIGLGTMLNGLLFSLPRKRMPSALADVPTIQATIHSTVATNELPNADGMSAVTEHTTHQLPKALRP